MRRTAYAILIVVGVALMLMPLTVPVFKSDAAYSVLNTNWNGVSMFGKLLYSEGNIQPVLAPYDSIDLENLKGVLIVIGPNVDFSNREIRELKTFLERGNTLVLADDFGTGNQVLRGLGVKERLSKSPIVSLFYSKSYEFPIVVDIRSNELSMGVEKIVLNEPAVILNTQNGLIYTSHSSVLSGKYGQFPIMAEIPYGKGRIILISDPDIFTNALFKENEAFLKNLVSYIKKGTFYIDEAHHRDFNPYSAGSIVVRRAINKELVFYYILFVAFLAFIIESGVGLRILEKVISLLFLIFQEQKESLDEIISNLEKEGFDANTLRRIVEEIRTGSKLGEYHGR
ncbi:DUF4350 domain-containing protein [Thermococcus barophilus]|uniref:DUF4350 domain-containing protein n=1 Tax=Thermococcus barophilus TaxID=55802 RepID=A0A0S1XFB3_THEBA|nr:DUF4350 domain-containing protein [Thermococcus barophilus]ALM76402.1 conserved exported hypothetical protein [Thermococcus barophilus]